MNVALSTVFALGAAALFGYSTVLQQTAVRQEEDGRSSSLPIAATVLLFALVNLVGKHQLRLRPADWLGALLVASGVATFLVLTPRSAGWRSPPSPTGCSSPCRSALGWRCSFPWRCAWRGPPAPPSSPLAAPSSSASSTR